MGKQEAVSAGGGVYAKLWAVMKDVSYIQKDGVNQFHKYRYASDEAIKDKLHAAMAKHGLIFLPVSSTVMDRISGLGKNGTEAVTTVRLRYRWVDAETGEMTEILEFDGQGSDPLDKGAYKAYTGASKYLLLNTFVIPTGDDAESNTAEEERLQRERDAEEAKRKQREAEKVKGNTSGQLMKQIAAVRAEIVEQFGDAGTTRYKRVAANIGVHSTKDINTLAKAEQLLEALKLAQADLRENGVAPEDEPCSNTNAA